MSGLAGGGCGKKTSLKCTEKGWRNYRWPSCLLRSFTLLHCWSIWKPVNCLLPCTIVYMELWDLGRPWSPGRKAASLAQVPGIDCHDITQELRVAEIFFKLLQMHHSATFLFTFCIWTFISQGLPQTNVQVLQVLFSLTGGQVKGDTCPDHAFLGTPLNNQAVILNSIRLLLLLTAENYSYGAYSLT